jgi:hypothetical protein
LNNWQIYEEIQKILYNKSIELGHTIVWRNGAVLLHNPVTGKTKWADMDLRKDGEIYKIKINNKFLEDTGDFADYYKELFFEIKNAIQMSHDLRLLYITGEIQFV